MYSQACVQLLTNLLLQQVHHLLNAFVHCELSGLQNQLTSHWTLIHRIYTGEAWVRNEAWKTGEDENERRKLRIFMFSLLFLQDVSMVFFCTFFFFFLEQHSFKVSIFYSTFNLPSSCFFVESFNVSALAHLQRSVYKHFKKWQTRFLMDASSLCTVLQSKEVEHYGFYFFKNKVFVALCVACVGLFSFVCRFE